MRSGFLRADNVLPARACTAFECKASFIKTQHIRLQCFVVVWEYLWSDFGVISSLCVFVRLPESGERLKGSSLKSMFRMGVVSVI